MEILQTIDRAKCCMYQVLSILLNVFYNDSWFTIHINRGRSRDRTVVGFITIYAIKANHH